MACRWRGEPADHNAQRGACPELRNVRAVQATREPGWRRLAGFSEGGGYVNWSLDIQFNIIYIMRI